MNMLAQWEDEENNRQVQFSIDHSIEDSNVVIDRVTPIKITFTCPETNTVLQSINVHTEKGKEMLRRQFVKSEKLDKLVTEISEKNGLLTTAN